MLTDTHCHLYYRDLKNNLPEIIQRAESLGVNRFICVGTNMTDSLECQKLSEQYDQIYFSAGVHPHDSKDASDDYLDQIKNFLIIIKWLQLEK